MTTTTEGNTTYSTHPQPPSFPSQHNLPSASQLLANNNEKVDVFLNFDSPTVSPDPPLTGGFATSQQKYIIAVPSGEIPSQAPSSFNPPTQPFSQPPSSASQSESEYSQPPPHNYPSSQPASQPISQLPATTPSPGMSKSPKMADIAPPDGRSLTKSTQPSSETYQSLPPSLPTESHQPNGGVIEPKSPGPSIHSQSTGSSTTRDSNGFIIPLGTPHKTNTNTSGPSAKAPLVNRPDGHEASSSTPPVSAVTVNRPRNASLSSQLPRLSFGSTPVKGNDGKAVSVTKKRHSGENVVGFAWGGGK